MFFPPIKNKFFVNCRFCAFLPLFFFGVNQVADLVRGIFSFQKKYFDFTSIECIGGHRLLFKKSAYLKPPNFLGHHSANLPGMPAVNHHNYQESDKPVNSFAN
jgi:hypothetical protein